MRESEPTTTQWVCEHCFIHLMNGDCIEPFACEEPYAPMHLFEGVWVTPGSLEHSCHDEGEERPDQCDCDENPFSWSWCDGCDAPYGGKRYAVTGWIEK